MLEGKEVFWLLFYGLEMCGGIVNCVVIVFNELVGFLFIIDDVIVVILLNILVFEKFKDDVIFGGKIIVNSFLIKEKVDRIDVDVYYILVNELVVELGNDKVVNMIMLGVYLKVFDIVDIEFVLEVFKKVFGFRKEKFVLLNREVL